MTLLLVASTIVQANSHHRSQLQIVWRSVHYQRARLHATNAGYRLVPVNQPRILDCSGRADDRVLRGPLSVLEDSSGRAKLAAGTAGGAALALAPEASDSTPFVAPYGFPDARRSKLLMTFNDFAPCSLDLRTSTTPGFFFAAAEVRASGMERSQHETPTAN